MRNGAQHCASRKLFTSSDHAAVETYSHASADEVLKIIGKTTSGDPDLYWNIRRHLSAMLRDAIRDIKAQ
jgi:hypothetical protein